VRPWVSAVLGHFSRIQLDFVACASV
jgi:hypothetical protein